MAIHRIKNGNKLSVQDLRAIAYFNRIIKNYEKMLRIERNAKSERKESKSKTI